MPRATRSTAKKQARTQTRSASATRKASAKTRTKTAARTTKSTAVRRVTKAKTAKSGSAAPAKSAARSRAVRKTTKVAKTPARTTARTPGRVATKPAKAPARRPLNAADKKFHQEQKALLLAERQTYTQQAESLRAEAEQLAEEMEPGDIQFDEESGEGGTMNVERERDLALSAQAQGAVDEIDKALAKIADGSYGYCEQCGQPIPKARLKALPYASLCVACKSGGLSRR